MSNQGRRKFEAIDIVKLFSTLTKVHWQTNLTEAYKKNNVEKLTKWRYGLQAGLADANSNGLGNEKLNMWVIKRIMNIEKCMRYILKKKYPMPGDVVLPKFNKGRRKDYVMDSKQAKRARDNDFEKFLKESAF